MKFLNDIKKNIIAKTTSIKNSVVSKTADSKQKTVEKIDEYKNKGKEKIDLAMTQSISKAEITKELIKSNPAIVKSMEVGDKISSTYRKRAVPILFGILTLLIIVLAASMILGAGYEKESSKDKRNLMDIARSKNVIECRIDSINDFFDSYYKAQAEGNTTLMEGMFDHPEKANITAQLSTIIENYSDIQVYVTPGLNKGEVVCFVYNLIHFNNILTAAPSVDSYYIYMDSENDKVLISTAMYTDESVRNFMKLISFRNPIRSVLSSAQDGLYGALESNTDLRNLYVVMSSMINGK